MPAPPFFERTRSTRLLPLWVLFPLFFAAVDLSHWKLLRLPYFWDEGGYYIPAALDFFRTGTLIPQSTITNAHPPLPSILLAAWWHFAGLAIVNTRTLVCLVAAAALLGVYRLARVFVGEAGAAVATLLTALYPVWFAQSTLAHADIFAAAFTLWAISFYLQRFSPSADVLPGSSTGTRHLDRSGEQSLRSSRSGETPVFRSSSRSARTLLLAAILFSLAALSKETAVVTPLALAAWEALQLLPKRPHASLRWAIALALPVLPLVAWYAFHYAKTGFVFGNPEFLRYNASANLDAHRIVLCLYHRLLHLTAHMNMFVPVLATLGLLLLPGEQGAPGLASETWVFDRQRIPKAALTAIALILATNLLEYSILGGALLTRYLLPMYPLVLLVCVAEWRRRLKPWLWPATLTAAAFLCGLWVNPPYAFAPEDNLTYRDMVVLHQRAIAALQQRYPAATVLTAWPATAELAHPELGYTRHAFPVASIQNFSREELQKAAADPGGYDTALLFSTKWEPPPGRVNLARQNEQADARYFDFHHDLRPAEAAALLHGEVVWQETRKGEWAAVLHFPRIISASTRYSSLNPVKQKAAISNGLMELRH